ncbi:pilus assembly protein [Rhodovulum sp. 12E13]|uniref:TadE family protein n=1 Tax=Rhodovulum sp. 12E13 TaxID=2203891 RepID=UPI000E193B83|nr:TadE family protein [Rhodovulum sp. 12E13]RDC71376.1 pilus assembly protein [Rhodovulum sp. 12E13]
MIPTPPLGFLRRFRRDDRGAMLVEAALVLPLMLVFMALIVETGRIAWVYQAAAGGVRDASRYVARTALVAPCPPSNTDALETTATNVINKTFAATINGSLATITNVEVTPRCVAGGFRGGDALVVEVSADVEITYVWGGIFGLVGTPLEKVTVRVADQARIYGV